MAQSLDARRRITSRSQVVQLVELSFQAADRDFAALVEEGKTLDIHVQCRAGCSACCTYAAHVTMGEAAVLADAVEALDQRTRQAVIDRLAAWNEAWKAYAQETGDAIAEHDRTAAGWGVKQITCPLLDPDDNLCLAYEARPMVCRTMHAVTKNTEDPRACPTCPDLEAPEACVVRPEHARCGHNPWVWQLRSDLTSLFGMRQLDLLNAYRLAAWIEPGILPVMVEQQGKARYGWRARRRVALPIWHAPTNDGAPPDFVGPPRVSNS